MVALSSTGWYIHVQISTTGTHYRQGCHKNWGGGEGFRTEFIVPIRTWRSVHGNRDTVDLQCELGGSPFTACVLVIICDSMIKWGILFVCWSSRHLSPSKLQQALIYTSFWGFTFIISTTPVSSSMRGTEILCSGHSPLKGSALFYRCVSYEFN